MIAILSISKLFALVVKEYMDSMLWLETAIRRNKISNKIIMKNVLIQIVVIKSNKIIIIMVSLVLCPFCSFSDRPLYFFRINLFIVNKFNKVNYSLEGQILNYLRV